MMRTLVIALLLAACGGKSSSTPPPPPPPAEHHEMENMPPALAKFHDVLAPRWHAAKGPQRMADTCAAIPDFKAGVLAIATAPAPANTDATTWNNATATLSQAVDGLDKTCQAQPVDAAAFEDAFTKVHQGFHGLLGEHEH